MTFLEFYNDRFSASEDKKAFITVKMVVDLYADYSGKKLIVKDNFKLLPNVVESYQYYDENKKRHHAKFVIMGMALKE